MFLTGNSAGELYTVNATDTLRSCGMLLKTEYLAEEKMQSSNFVINLLIVQHLMLIAVILVSLWNTKVHV